MKNLRMTFTHRDRERGAIALLVAVMWTALFGMAVMAVDFGYLYTKKRGMQGAVDGALKAAMPVFKANGGGSAGYSAAQAPARSVAQLSGFQNAEVTFPTGLPNNQFAVTIQRSHPTFFGGLFGIGQKTLSASATGQLTGAAGGTAIYSTDTTGCAVSEWDNSKGIDITGGGILTVNGDITGQNKIHIGTPGAGSSVTGMAQSPCVGSSPPGVWNDQPIPITGGITSGTPTDPIGLGAASFGAACLTGSIAMPMAMGIPGGLPWGAEIMVAGKMCNPLPSSIYCASDMINVSPPGPNKSICPSNVSFFSASNVLITGDGEITLSPAPSAPKGVIAFANGPTGGGPNIQLSNGAILGKFTLNGAIYAPNGLINLGTGTPGFSMSGALAGKVVNISTGVGQPWVFNVGGGSGTGWRVYR